MKLILLKKMICLLTAAICYIGVIAQTNGFTLQGRVEASKGVPAGGTNVTLLLAKDSSLVKATITSAKGEFEFTGVPQGTYLVAVTHVGYQKQLHPVTLSASVTMPVIQLAASEAVLSDVTVTARRQLIEQKFDKIIFNVSGNVTAAGNSALELLAKAPGVQVDHDGSISLGGRPGVLVLIDGKRTHLSASDLAAYLRGLPAGSIDRIELISNPSAQYEAEGTSGIIDIRLKKDNRLGYNGSVNLAYLAGTASSGNGSINFNYRRKNLNIFGNFSKTYEDVNGRQESERRFFTDDGADNGSILTFNKRDFRFNNNNLRIGADYYAGKKTVIGIVMMGLLNNVRADYRNRTENYYPGDSSDYALDNSLNITRRNNAAFNFNIRRTVDTAGREWTFDFDYAPYRNNDDIKLTADFYNKQSVPNRPYYELTGDLTGKLDVFSTRFDYQLPKVMNGTVQLGVRSSLVESDNNLVFMNRSTGTPVPDTGKTNHFVYRENINAAYANYQLRQKKLSLQLGLRLENTNGRGTQLTTGQKIERSYVQLFPNVYAGYDITKNYSMGISVARRIDRPSYGQLNPFRFYGSPFGYTEGNAYLNPQRTFVVELTNTFYKRYIARLSYARTADIIGMVWGLDPVDKRISAQRPVNLQSASFYRLTLTAPVTISNKFNSFNNIIGIYSTYKGEAFNTSLDRSLPTFYISSNNTFNVTKTLTVEMNVWYRTATLQAGYQKLRPASSMALGLGKRIMNGRGNLRFNVSDIFWTNLGNGVTDLDNYQLTIRQWNESRRATLSFSWNFGKSTVPAARNRTSSAEEERSRAQ
ncbi:MAG TPA: TonB-dependent receptor [Chitinophagaceae bacterium]|nr:TonB-dependent receptor [Chitinophagaceae bacterium]